MVNLSPARKSIVRATLFMAILCMAGYASYGQTPTITSLSTTSGAVGSTLTINGTNFNAVPASNVVFLGAVRAPLVGGTTTTLTVNVPVGATYQYVSVTNLSNGLTAYSQKPFITTLSNGNIAFAAHKDTAAGSNPYSVSVGDIDGDGRPDVVVVNAGRTNVEVYRNASSAGSVSFAPGVTVPTGSAPSFVTIGDLDGDGKPDLVIANNGAGNITVIHNISSAGSIAFSAPATFTTGSGTFSVSIADIDGDGKPDLAVANQLTSGVSVLHNTSTVGSISFAAQVTFGVGYEPSSIAFGDIDGDGKTDMVVSNFDSNSVSILRNTSAVGTISFAAQVVYHVGLSPLYRSYWGY